MPETAELISQFYVKLNGQDAPDELTADLLEISVETSLHLPDVCTVSLHDPRLRWVDDDRLSPGKPLQITARAGKTERPIFDGEIVELEPRFGPATHKLTVRAFDRLHRLARGQRVRSFQNVTDGDLVQRLAREVGLRAQVGPTSQVYPYVFQNNESNLAFLRQRAAGLGYLLYVRGSTLHCEPPGGQGAPIELEWGSTLHEFYPRLTTVNQLTQVTVRGWDPATRQTIVGTARKGQGSPQIGEKQSGGELASSAFNAEAQGLLAHHLPTTQAEADRLARAAADRHAGAFIEAEGTAAGDPAIVAGASLHITSVGERFSGTYFVTSATHVYAAHTGYKTHFGISGLHPQTLLTVLAPETHMAAAAGGAAGGGRQYALGVGIVTDNNDPSHQGRVKVMFPWLTSDHASDWARVVVVGGGDQRGIEFLPEVNDEVLVGFEMGNIHHPYILGGLWNGQDAPPVASGTAISGGKVRQRIIRSRAGHVITLDDTEGGGGVTVADRNGNKVQLDSGANKLTITVQGDASIEAQGNLELKAQGNLTLSSQGQLDAEGTSVSLKGQANVEIKGQPIMLN